MIAEPSDLLARLLEGGHTVVAGRLAGAFRNIGRGRIAARIIETMRTAGYAATESDPFGGLRWLPMDDHSGRPTG